MHDLSSLELDDSVEVKFDYIRFTIVVSLGDKYGKRN